MPAIITGDFNCTPDETPLQTLEKEEWKMRQRWQPLRTVHPGLSMISGRLPLEERVLLDYVFVSGGMKTNRYRVIQIGRRMASF